MEDSSSIDIKLSIKTRSTQPKNIHVAKTLFLCNLVFLNYIRRLINSTTLYAALISLIPPHIMALMESFSGGVDRTAKSLIILYGSWLRGMKPTDLSKNLSTQSVLIKILQLIALSRFTSIKSTIIHMFSFDFKNEPRSFIEFNCRDEEIFYLDTGNLEVKNLVPHLPKHTAKITFAIGSNISLVLNASPAKKSFSQHALLLSELMTIPFFGNNSAKSQVNSDSQTIPDNIKSLKNHPIFILESHLKKYEVIYPQEVAGFLDNEAVYFRQNVCKVKSKEAWLTQHGMAVENFEQPAKVVLLSSKTNKLQNLYGPWQVKKCERPICEDGKIPVNKFGNVDLFVPDMVPIGCVHINLPEAKKIAKNMGINHAEACTGFSFRKGKAVPDISGIVIHEADYERFNAEYSKMMQVIRQKELSEFETKLIQLWKNACDAIVNGRRIKMSSRSSLCTVKSKRYREEVHIKTSIFDDSEIQTKEAFENI